MRYETKWAIMRGNQWLEATDGDSNEFWTPYFDWCISVCLRDKRAAEEIASEIPGAIVMEMRLESRNAS